MVGSTAGDLIAIYAGEFRMRKRTPISITVGIAFAAYLAFPWGGTTELKTSEAADRSSSAPATAEVAVTTAGGGRSALAGRMRGRAASTTATAQVTGTTAPVVTRHLALNTSRADWPKLTSLGYDVFDVGPDEAEINALPRGAEAMVWVGASSCEGSYEISFDSFTGLVDRLGRHPKVFGWYLADEPDPKSCPALVPEIRRRADYINAHAPGQVAFISATDYEYGPLRPRNTHVDLIGLDPYPCFGRTGRCTMNEIDRLVRGAIAGGIPRDVIVPVIQVFGQECSRGMRVTRLPSEAELRQILARWRRLVPEPVLEISYSWGPQEQWACPTLSEADGTNGHPDLQSIMKTHNGRRTAPAPVHDDDTSPAPSPAPSSPAPSPCTAVTAGATPPSRR
jgi:hypothetical protein